MAKFIQRNDALAQRILVRSYEYNVLYPNPVSLCPNNIIIFNGLLYILYCTLVLGTVLYCTVLVQYYKYTNIQYNYYLYYQAKPGNVGPPER